MSSRGDYLAERLIELDIDMSEDYTSKGITLGHMSVLSIQVVISNTDIDGALSFECSNNNENWIPLEYIAGDTGNKRESYTVEVGTDVNEIFNWMDLAVGFVRLKWEKNAGNTATMSAWAIRKRN